MTRIRRGGSSAAIAYSRAMGIDRSAAATAAGETQIDADPQAVFSVIAAIDDWPAWNPDVKSAKLEGPLRSGTAFRWKSGPGTIASTLQVVNPPTEIGWTGKTMGIKATHVFRFEPNDGGTLAHSEESFEGLIPRLLPGYSRKTLDKAIKGVLSQLKTEAERRAHAA